MGTITTPHANLLKGFAAAASVAVIIGSTLGIHLIDVTTGLHHFDEIKTNKALKDEKQTQ